MPWYGVLARAILAQRRRAAAANQMALPPANKLCPPGASVGTAWTIPWKAFGAQETDPPVPRVAQRNPNSLKASGCWGSLKAPGNTTSWRYLQRISTASRSASLASPAQHSMCSSMACNPESKQCILILPAACTRLPRATPKPSPRRRARRHRRAPQATATSSTARPATRGRRRTTTSRATQL